MIPKKVYISIAVWDDGRKYDFIEVRERPYQTTDTQCHWREYTDLSQVWHDVSEEPEIGSNIIVVDEDGQWWDIKPYDGEYDGYGELTGWKCCVVHYNNIQRWAYIDDLLPKTK